MGSYSSSLHRAPDQEALFAIQHSLLYMTLTITFYLDTGYFYGLFLTHTSVYQSVILTAQSFWSLFEVFKVRRIITSISDLLSLLVA